MKRGMTEVLSGWKDIQEGGNIGYNNPLKSLTNIKKGFILLSIPPLRIRGGGRGYVIVAFILVSPPLVHLNPFHVLIIYTRVGSSSLTLFLNVLKPTMEK
jgi:hypothetical protein